MKKPQEQLIKMVGKENAEKYLQIVKAMMQADGEQEELQVVNK